MRSRIGLQRAIALALGVIAVTTLPGCGDVNPFGNDGVESDAERFCGEAVAQRDMIVTPPMSSEAELEATLDFYRLMGDLAPVAIAEQWNDIVQAMETASTVVIGDLESEQRAALQAYATERSAYEVSVWLRRNCGVDIPITTIAPQDPMPARTTTLPGSTVAPEG